MSATTETSGERLLTIAEAAERLRISRPTCYRLASSGVLPSIRVSAGAVRISSRELDDWLNTRRRGRVKNR